MVVSAAIGARTHGDHPARFRHLIVDLAQGRRHLVHKGAGDDHHIGLTGTGTEYDSEPVQIIAGRTCMHHLHRTACEAKSHRPHCAGTRPVDKFVHGSRNDSLRHDSFN